jgi:hypothetical protein
MHGPTIELTTKPIGAPLDVRQPFLPLESPFCYNMRYNIGRL